MRCSLRGLLLRAAVDPIVRAITAFKEDQARKHSQLERLEPRQLLNGISGTTGDDTIEIHYNGSHISSIKVNNDDPIPNFTEPVSIDGGLGQDLLRIYFDSTGTATYKPNTSGAGQITHRKRATLNFSNIESHTILDLSKLSIITPGSVDALSVQREAAAVTTVTGSSDTVALPSFHLISIPKLVLDTAANDTVGGGSGNDSITVGAVSASGALNTKLLVNSGTGLNTLDVLGDLDTTINTTFGEAGANLTVDVHDDATVSFLTTQVLRGLNLHDDAKVTLPAHHYHVLGTNALTIDNGAVLDLTDNDMIVHSAPNTTNAVNLNYITQLITSGFHNGAWDGSGIISTLAGSGGLLMLGVTPAPGQPEPADILVKFTYAGDNNLDRTVSISDLIDVSSHFSQVGGWGQGDFNYDGVVTIADFIIASVNNNHAQPLSPTISGPDSWVNAYVLDLNANSVVSVLGWAIDWGDGEFEAIDGNPQTTAHIYDDEGTYIISASARNSELNYTAPSKTITISDLPLAAYILPGPTNVSENTQVNFQSRIVNETGQTPTYSWLVKKNNAPFLTSSQPTLTFTPNDNATYTIDLSLSVPGQSPATAAQRSLIATNVNPTLSVAGPQSVDEGASYPLTLSWTDVGDDTISKWDIAWGDGSITHLRRKPSWSAGSLSERHTYADGVNSYIITATATDEDGTYTLTATNNSAFGTNGIALANLDSPHAIRPSMATLANGQFLVASDSAASNADFVVTRFNADGSRDTSFGPNGNQVISLGGDDHPMAIAVTAQGEIVVAGYSVVSGKSLFAVARIDTAGTVTTRTKTYDSTRNYRAQALAIQTTGAGEKFIIGGYATDPANASSTLFAVVRFNNDLTVDNSFGSQGMSTVRFDTKASINAVATQSIEGESRIVAAGQTTTNIAMARFAADGALDESFENGGQFTTEFGSSSAAMGVAIGQQARIVVAGKTDSDFAVVRYNHDGSLDETFGDGGTADIDFLGSSGLAYGVHIGPDDRIVAVGQVSNGSNTRFGMVRLNSDGSRDTALSATGAITTDLSAGADRATSVKVLSDGRFLVAGQKATTGTTSEIVVASYPFVGVKNVDPRPELSIQSPAEGGQHHLTVTADDPGTDTISSWAINWGDGSDVSFDQRPVNVAHSYNAPGMKNIVVTLTDEDGSHSTTFPTRIAAIPFTPSNPSATPHSSGDITLHWTNTSTWATRIEIEANLGGTAFTRIATLPPNSTDFLVKGFDRSTSFRVRASSDAGDSAYTTIQGLSFNDTQKPSISSLSAGQPTDHSIQLTWSGGDNVGVAGFEIFRDDKKVASVEGNSYTDIGLKPGTQYKYNVRAFDLAWNFSDPVAPVFKTTKTVDVDPPAAPSNLQFDHDHIEWNDVDGAAGYEVYRNGLRLGTTHNNHYLADTGYGYSVFAYDDAGIYSAAATITTQGSPEDEDEEWIDGAPDQFFTQQILDYFYDQLEYGLRDRAGHVGTSPPPSKRWLDVGNDFVFLAGGGSVGFESVWYLDLNENGRWNADEPAWRDSSFGEQGKFDSGDAVLFGSPSNGAKGIGGSIPFKDPNNDGVKQGNEVYIIPDIYLIKGAQGKLAYRDANGDGRWGFGEHIWIDLNDDSIYQSSEAIAYAGQGQLAAGVWGKKEGLNYSDDDGDGQPNGTDIVWADRTTFRQDVVAMYAGIESLAGKYEKGGSSENCVIPLTKGDILGSGNGVRNGTGTLTATGLHTVHVDNSTAFDVSHLVPGAAVKILGKWYDIVSASQAYLGLGGENLPPGTHSYQIVDWTRVPETIGEDHTQFYYVPGRVQLNDLLFREHFDELRAALNRLVQPIHVRVTNRVVYDSSSAAEYLAAAAQVANIAGSLLGADVLGPLNNLISSGAISPGQPLSAGDISILQDLLNEVMSHIFRSSSNSTPADPVPYEETWHIGDPNWFPTCDNGDPTDALDDILRVANGILNNGLWIWKGGPAVAAHGTGAEKRENAQEEDVEHEVPRFSDRGLWDLIDENSFPANSVVPLNFIHDVITKEIGASSVIRIHFHNNVYYQAAGLSETRTAPNQTNPFGGNSVVTLAEWVDSAFAHYRAPGTQWERVLYTRGDVDAMMQGNWSFPDEPPSCESVSVQQPSSTPNELGLYLQTRSAGIQDNCVDPSLEIQTRTMMIGIGYQPPAGFNQKFYGRIPITYFPLPSPPDPVDDFDPPPSPIDLPPPPEIPQTTELDYRNTIDDLDLDQIVQVEHDQSSFGADTGSIYFHPQREKVQVVLPIWEDNWAPLAIHAYLAQGGLSSSDTQPRPLRNKTWTGIEVDENGTPYAYSLDTRVRTNILLHADDNHIKRVEVIRPRGNAVVFDFPWNSETGHFDAVAELHSHGGRDRFRNYRLVDLTPAEDQDQKYKLFFPSGVVHEFNGGLIKVSDSSGRSLALTASPSLPAHSVDREQLTGNRTANDVIAASSAKYDLYVSWKGGQIEKMAYRAGDDDEIRTKLHYSPEITELNKFDDHDSAIPQFSYKNPEVSRIEDGRYKFVRNGNLLTITPLDASVSGKVKILTELNPHGLIHTQTTTLENGSETTDSTYTYEYVPNGQIGKIIFPDSSWEIRNYDDNGWLSSIVTPFKSSSIGQSNNSHRVQEFHYDHSESGHGQPAETMALTERPRLVVTKVQGIEVGRTYLRYSRSADAGFSAGGDVLIRQTRLPGETWNGPSDPRTANLETWITPHSVGDANVIGATAGVRHDAIVQGKTLAYSTQQLGPGGVGLLRTEETINGFGTSVDLTTRDIASNLPISKLKSKTDSFGRVTEIENELTGRKATFDDYTWSGPQSSNDFDRVISSYTYTPTGQLESVSALGISTDYKYDAAGNVISEKRSGQGGPAVETSARFDALGRPTRLADEEGKLTTIAYTTENNLLVTTITYADQKTYIEKRHLDGSLQSISGSAAFPVEFDSGISDAYTVDGDDGAYGFWTSVTEHSAANEAVTTKTFYNPLGQAYQSERPAPGGTAHSYTRFDALSRPIQQIGFDGVSTAFAYNRLGDLEDVILDADGDGFYTAGERRTSYLNQYTTRDGAPVFQSQTTIHGDNNTADIVQTSAVSLDGQHTWQDDNGVQSRSTLRYLDDAGASRVTLYHPDGTSTEISYADRTPSSQKLLGTNGQIIQSLSLTPDSLLRNKSTQDAFGTSSNELLKNGLVKTATLPDGRTIEITGRDNKTYIPTDITRADGKSTHRDVDARGQITGQGGAGVIPSVFVRSPQNGALTSLTTNGSATTTWGYAGQAGFLSSKTYAGGDSISYEYNAQLRLAEIQREGSNEVRSYDLTTGDWTERNFNNGALRYQVDQRDILGRIKQLTQTDSDGSRLTEFGYTAQNQLQKETLPQFGQNYFDTFYEYFGAGETSGSASPGATKSVAIRAGAQDAVKETYSYNEPGKRLHSISTGNGTFAYDYFPGTDLIRSITAPNGQITTYSYEPNTGRLSGVSSSVGSQTIYSIDYGYNDNDQRKRAEILAGDVGGNLSSQSWDFDYDDQDQLIYAHAYGNDDEPLSAFDYSFDAVGNHTENGWTTNIANQVTHIPGLNATITYDDRGNVTYDGHFHYTWDAADHLIEAEVAGVAKFEFGYDSQGRRTWKKSFGWANNAWNLAQHLIFAYDGWNLMAEYEQVTVGTGQNEHIEHHLLRSYAWGQNLGGGIGGLLAITDHSATGGPKTYYPFYDGNGNVMGLTDSLGQVAATYKYDPFGKLIASTGPAADINPFLFSTKYYDADTQLYYFGYRYYSSELQRWLSRDPIEEDGGLNVYAFVGNDPVNRIDPMGLDDVHYLDYDDGEWDGRFIFVTVKKDDICYPLGPQDRCRVTDVVDNRRYIEYRTVVQTHAVDVDRNRAEWLAKNSPERLRIKGSLAIWYSTSFDRTWDNVNLLLEAEQSRAKAVQAFAQTTQSILTQGADAAADFLPGFGWIKAGYEGITGRSFLKADENVGFVGQVLGLGVVVSSAYVLARFAAPTEAGRSLVRVRGINQQAERIEARLKYIIENGKGFDSFDSLKAFLGKPAEGEAWHHIVEQTPHNVGRFGKKMIHNTGNIFAVKSGSKSTHEAITNFYSGIHPEVTGSHTLTVRQYLADKSYEFQWEFGILILNRFGVNAP